MKALIAAVFLTFSSVLALAEVPAAGSVAFFGLHFSDTSAEGSINGARPDETARTAMATGLVTEDMMARGFTLVPTDPVAADLAKVSNPAHCNGCEIAMAKTLGADYALTGEVQKVSNLILNINLYLRDVQSGDMVRSGSVDIRGNTDESWTRGVRYLLKNIIFRDR